MNIDVILKLNIYRFYFIYDILFILVRSCTLNIAISNVSKLMKDEIETD